MLGKLNDTQIKNLMLSQAIGRIGCISGNHPYIVPVTYVFNGKDIYGQANEGMKMDAMRKNPHVCFQVDLILNMANWQSVIVDGIFEELMGKEADKARAYLYESVLPLMTGSEIHSYGHTINGKLDDGTRVKSVMYRIKIKKISGKFEKQ